MGCVLKLFWSDRSPFARKVCIAAWELGLADRLELRPTLAMHSREDADLVVASPLGQIPVLITDEGESVFDSIVICEWLDLTLRPDDMTPLFPRDAAARITALRHNALADAALSFLLQYRQELRRPDESRNPGLMDAFLRRIGRSLDWLEHHGPAAPDEVMDIGQVAVATLLSYSDFRLDGDWRTDRPGLAQWYDAAAVRPSMANTHFNEAQD